MSRITHRRAALCVVAFALVVPATASAHPGVFSVTAKLAPAGVVYPNTGGLVDDPQYAIINDGRVIALRENNGVTTGGMINYKLLPGGLFRADMTSEEKRSYGPAQTGVQAHATCSGVAALASPANILAWQGNDPFFNYVPFQEVSAGFGDDALKWIPVVKAATGVDLSTVTDFAAACAGLGGAYHAADGTVTSVTNASSATVAEAVTAAVGPIQAQLDSLITAKAGVDSALTAAQAAAATAVAEVARLKLAATPLAFTLTGKHSPSQIAGSGLPLKLAGPAGEKVRVRLLVSAARAKALKLRSTVLATTNTTFGRDAGATLTLKPAGAAKQALSRVRGSVPVSLEAVAGQRSLMTKTTLAR